MPHPSGHRPVPDVRDGLARWLAVRRGVDHVTVDEIEQPSVGYSASTLLFRARHDGAASVTEHLVLRMAPTGPGLFPDYDLGAQQAAQVAAGAAGVPVAAPLTLESDPSWLGAPFLVMARVDGHIVGEAPAFDPWIEALGAAGQAELHARFIDTVGRIHAADVRPARDGGVPARSDAEELSYWDHYLRWSSEGAPLPALMDALDWCRRHVPDAPSGDPVLCWGDVRLGNVVVGDDLRLRAVLDWDMAVIGAPEHDLAWHTVLTSTMATLTGRGVAGFPDRDATVSHYERTTGRELHDFEWYETFALLRSTAVMTRIGLLALAAGQTPTMPVDDNPILDLLRARMQG